LSFVFSEFDAGCWIWGNAKKNNGK
jgi:hypothetical protein